MKKEYEKSMSGRMENNISRFSIMIDIKIQNAVYVVRK
jgi:hypothetical protein